VRRSSTAGHAPHPDVETIAAFLDGRLKEADRTRVADHLDSCPSCFELFSETAHVLEELEGEESSEPVSPPSEAVLRPPRSRWRSWRVPGVLLPLAAVLALLVLAPWRGVAPLPVDELTASLAPAETAPIIADGIDSRHQWPQMLGAGVTLSEDEENAFRLGVRMVEMEIALRQPDAATATILTHRIESLLLGIELSGPLRRNYVEPDGIRALLAEEADAADLLALHHQADRLLGPDPDSGEPGFTDPFWYRFGKWAGSAQLAALTGNGAWFEETGSRRLLREIRKREMPADLEQPLAELARELEADPAERDLGAMAELLGDVIRIAGDS
jgi:hypothetical protein